ncbi:MAG: sulfatase-like hydrolase/transferase [Desulfovibrionaceae bacterium]|nr:sulfatase-like hydrolase/transferase [Desulfovibrionaceae bacterium]
MSKTPNLLISLLLILITAGGVMFVQHLCLEELTKRLIVLDISAAALIVFGCRRRSVAAIVFLMQCAAGISFISYATSMGTPPSIAAIINGAGLAVPTIGGILDYIPATALLPIVILLIQLLLLRAAWLKAPLKVLIPLAVVYGLLMLNTFRYVPLNYLTKEGFEARYKQAVFIKNPLSESVRVRGILASFAVELITDYPGTLREMKAPISPHGPTDNLPIFRATRRIALIQVESLDFELLDLRVNGALVMPFLHSLTSTSHVFRLDGTKKLTSANSDFEIFNGRIASPQVNHYEVETNYGDSLLRILKQYGLNVTAFHGMPRNYMNREHAQRLQGVDVYYSLEEMKKAGVPALPIWWGGCMADADTLSFAADNIPDGPFAHFIFTIDMHMAPDVEQYSSGKNFSSKADAFHHLCSTTDAALQTYVKALPEGTTVILWGDHSSYFVKNSDHIPLLIHIKGEEHPFDGRDIDGLTRSNIYYYLKKIFETSLGSGLIN